MTEEIQKNLKTEIDKYKQVQKGILNFCTYIIFYVIYHVIIINKYPVTHRFCLYQITTKH